MSNTFKLSLAYTKFETVLQFASDAFRTAAADTGLLYKAATRNESVTGLTPVYFPPAQDLREKE